MFNKKVGRDKIPFLEAFPLFLSSIKRVWKLDKKYVIVTCFVFILGTIPELFGAFVTAIFNQRLIIGAEEYVSYFYAYYPLLLAFCVTIIHGVFFSVWRWIETKSMDKITSFLLRESVQKASMIDYCSYDDPEFYDRVQKGWSQDGKMFINSASTVFNSIAYIIGLFAYVSVLAYIDWKLMLFITIFIFAVYPLSNLNYIWIYRLNNQLAEFRRKEQYYRTFFGNKEMTAEGRVFALYDYAKQNYLRAHNEIYRATFLHKLKISGVGLLSSIVYNLPLAAGYIYLSVCVYKGTVSLANMTLFVSMYIGFINQVYNTFSNIIGFKYYAEQSRYSREFLDLPTSIYTSDDVKKLKIGNIGLGHTLEFNNVSFKYPNTEKKVLENVSFLIKENEMVSLIGDNGAGKTTIVHLLMRLYDPTEGFILLDGKDLREYSTASLYEIFSVLFQDYTNYKASVRESITFAMSDYVDERLEYSLKASTAYKYVYDLDNGVETQLSRSFDSNGIELSIGQKQRIALARAFYKDGEIVVFDEPSASIDPESESDILDSLIRIKGTRNVFLISHRLSTCVLSDKILLLKDGKLIGDGSHNELIKTNAEYKRMFRLQADRYEVN